MPYGLAPELTPFLITNVILFDSYSVAFIIRVRKYIVSSAPSSCRSDKILVQENADKGALFGQVQFLSTFQK